MLEKIKVRHIISAISFFIITIMYLLSGRYIVDSIQRSLSIDQDLANSSSPQLNKSAINKAIELITDDKINLDLKPKEIENKKTILQNNLKIEKVDIVNRSGIAGAAKDVSTIFDKNIDISLRNSKESDSMILQQKSEIYYDPKFENQILQLKTRLSEKKWPVAIVAEKENNDKYDIMIVLGTK